MGVGHRIRVPAQLGLEELDLPESLTEPSFVTDEIVAEDEELLA
jgi:hypothetical protein